MYVGIWVVFKYAAQSLAGKIIYSSPQLVRYLHSYVLILHSLQSVSIVCFRLLSDRPTLSPHRHPHAMTSLSSRKLVMMVELHSLVLQSLQRAITHLRFPRAQNYSFRSSNPQKPSLSPQVLSTRQFFLSVPRLRAAVKCILLSLYCAHHANLLSSICIVGSFGSPTVVSVS